MGHGNRVPDAPIERWHLMQDVSCTQIDDSRLLLEKEGVKILLFWPEKADITIWKEEILVPSIIKDSEELLPVIDAAFATGKEGPEDIGIVSLSLLMLDVTDLKELPETEELAKTVNEILNQPDRAAALNSMGKLD